MKTIDRIENQWTAGSLYFAKLTQTIENTEVAIGKAIADYTFLDEAAKHLRLLGAVMCGGIAGQTKDEQAIETIINITRGLELALNLPKTNQIPETGITNQTWYSHYNKIIDAFTQLMIIAGRNQLIVQRKYIEAPEEIGTF